MNEKKMNKIQLITIAALAFLAFGCNNPSNPGAAVADPPKASAPIIAPDAGTISEFTEITITGPDGATVYFSTDGTAPDETSSVYTAPFTLPVGSVTVMAYAVVSGSLDSDFTSVDYTVEASVAPVTFADPDGEIPDDRDIALSTATPGATIYYTVDGSDPTTASAVYAAPFTMADLGTTDLTVNAFAVLSGYADSAISTAAYTKAVAAAPVADQADGSTISNTMAVSLSSDTVGAAVYYTTDGMDPTTASNLYTAPFTLPVGSAVVKSYTVLAGYADSSVTTVNLTVEAQAEVPAVSDTALFQMSGTTVSLSTSSGLETILYTIDGTDPAVSGLTYAGPIALTDSLTLRAIAGGSGYYPSSEVSVEYKVYENIAGLAADSGALMAVSPSGAVAVRSSGSYYDLSGASLSARTLSFIQPAGTVLDFALDGSGDIHALYLVGTDLVYWTSDAGTTATVSTAAVSLADARILLDSIGNARIVFAQYADASTDELVEAVYSAAGSSVRTSTYPLMERATAVDAALDSADVLSIAITEVKGAYTETAVVAYDEVTDALAEVMAWKNRAGNPALAVMNDDSLVMGFVRPDKGWFTLLDVATGVNIYTIKSLDASVAADSSIVPDGAGDIYASTAGSLWYYDGTAETVLPITEAPFRIAGDATGAANPYILAGSGMTLYAVK